MRSLVLAHHWTLAEVASLTVEQLVWSRQWQVDPTPARVGRDEARAIVAARREARATWVAAVLANKASVPRVHTPLATQRPLHALRTQARLVQASVAMPDRSLAGRSLPEGVSHEPLLHHDRSSSQSTSPSMTFAPSIAPKSPPAGREAGPLSDLIVQLAGQLDRLERRIQRGAPLGP